MNNSLLSNNSINVDTDIKSNKNEPKNDKPITVPPPLENLESNNNTASINKMSITPLKSPSKSPSKSPLVMKIPKMNNDENKNENGTKNTGTKVKAQIEKKEEIKSNDSTTNKEQKSNTKKKKFKRAVNLKSNKARC